jgi:hypothetical protein
MNLVGPLTNIVEREFYVEGFGKVGYSNLEAFAPFDGFKQPRDLEVNETTEGKFWNPASDKRPERITRTR